MSAHVSLDQRASFTRHGVTFERLAALHGQIRYKATDRLGRVWLVARDGSVQYPWRAMLMCLRAECFAITLDEAAEIIANLTREQAPENTPDGDASRVLFIGAVP